MNHETKHLAITCAVAILCALITAAATLYPAIKKVENAADDYEAAAEKLAKAYPGALATHYRGSRKLVNATTKRFNFDEKIYDPDGAVISGKDWRFQVPIDGVYFVGTNFRVPYGPHGRSHKTPYASCTITVIRVGTTAEERIASNRVFTPSCSVSGVFLLSKGDQLYSTMGQAGAFPGIVDADFYSVLVGNGKEL